MDNTSVLFRCVLTPTFDTIHHLVLPTAGVASAAEDRTFEHLENRL
jgi:hypothetical protein